MIKCCVMVCVSLRKCGKVACDFGGSAQESVCAVTMRWPYEGCEVCIVTEDNFFYRMTCKVNMRTA